MHFGWGLANVTMNKGGQDQHLQLSDRAGQDPEVGEAVQTEPDLQARTGIPGSSKVNNISPSNSISNQYVISNSTSFYY